VGLFVKETSSRKELHEKVHSVRQALGWVGRARAGTGDAAGEEGLVLPSGRDLATPFHFSWIAVGERSSFVCRAPDTQWSGGCADQPAGAGS
jgi:hypothetical protein